MKKLISLIGVFFIISFALIGCSNNKVKQESKIEQIKKNKKIVLGTSAAYPPYEFHKKIDGQDQIVGFDIEIARKIAEKLEVELEIKDMQFDGLLAALNNNKIDLIIAGMTPTQERKKNVDFSKIYYTATQNIVINKKNLDKYKNLQHLDSKIIGVQKGTIQEEIANKNFKNSQIKAIGKISNVMMDLINDKVEAVIVEAPVAKAYVSKNPSLAISDIKINENSSGSAIALKKGNDEFKQIIDEVLDDLIKNNKIEKYVNEAVELSEK